MADVRPKRDWRAEAMVPAGASASPSKASLFLASFLAVTIIGILAGLAYWLFMPDAGPVRFITMPLCEYDAPWPPVPFSEADAKRLLSHFPGGERAFSAREQELFSQKVQSLKSHTTRPLVVHVTGLAVVKQGKVFLLSSRAKPGEPDLNWYPLDDLLNAMAQCPVKDKLLILDLAYAVAAPNTGVLVDAVSSTLATQIGQYIEENRNVGMVLLSCGPNEFSLPIEEAGSTLFGYFLDEGLKGAADGATGETPDHWVNVRELAGYVTNRVSRWAFHARAMSQNPRLLGDGDFRLVGHQHVYQAETPEVKPVVYPKWLTEAWSQRDQWAAQGAWTLAPNIMRRMETELLRIEARHRAGAAEATLKSDWTDVSAGLKRGWDKLQELAPPQKTPIVDPKDAPKPPVVESKIPPKFSILGVKVPPALEEKVETWLATADPKKKLAESLGDLKPRSEELLACFWNKLNSAPLKRDIVAMIVNEVVTSAGHPQFAEAVFCVKLKQLVNRPVFVARDRAWPDKAVHAAVIAEQTWLEASHRLRPEGFQWLAGRLNDVSRKRHKLEEENKSSNPQDLAIWELGKDGLHDANKAADQVTKSYKDLNSELTALRDDAIKLSAAIDALIKGIAELPGFALWLARLDPSQRADVKEQWIEGMEAATTIANIVDGKPEPFPADLLSAQTDRLNLALSKLNDQLTKMVNSEPNARMASAIFAMPRLDGKKREEFYTRWYTWSAGKHLWTLENELGPSGQPAPASNALPEGDRPALRARIAIDLGRLSGQNVGPLADEWSRIDKMDDLSMWENFGPKLLPIFAPPDMKAKSGEEVDAVNARIGGVFGTTAAPATAAARQRQQFWRWLVEQYDAEAGARGMTNAEFYRKAAAKAGAASDAAGLAARP